jgi:hypothetical protein
VHYVSLKKKATRNEGPKNILDVLRAIIANDSNSQFGQALPAKSFYRFNALVNYLLGPSEPNPSSIPAARRVEDKGFLFRDLDHESINAILDAFKLGLRNASQHQILVLALDDLSTVTVRTDHFQRYLLPNLITPIAKGSETNLKNVRMIAAVKEDEYGELGLSDLENYALTIKLDWLDKDERALFARDLCILKQVKQVTRDRIQSLLESATVPTVPPSKVFELVTLWTNDFLAN